LRGGAIELQLLFLQLLNEVNAEVDPVGLEVQEVQASAAMHRTSFTRKVYQLGQ
jgi:hypothetical protein